MSFCTESSEILIGSGIRKPDDEKVATVKDMQVPETKKQVRR